MVLSLLVAIQCLINAFSLSPSQLADPSLPNLASLIESVPKSSTSDQRAAAEKFKNEGNDFIVKKKPTEAVSCYTRAIELDPTNAVYYCNRAAAYAMLNEHFKVVEDAKKSIELNPSYSKAYNRLGKAYLSLGEPEEAVTAFEKAAELEPRDATIKASLEQARRAASGDEGLEAAFGGSSGTPAPAAMSGMPPMDFASLLKDPNMMKMAQEMMNSGAMDKIMRDPSAQEMLKNMSKNPDLISSFFGNRK